MSNRITPLHLAAKNGHIEICKFIAANPQNIRPVIGRGIPIALFPLTLFDLAFYRGRFQIAKFFLENNIENIIQFWLVPNIVWILCEAICREVHDFNISCTFFQRISSQIISGILRHHTIIFMIHKFWLSRCFYEIPDN